MIYVFDDDYELDLQRYELRYAGKLVRVEPQVFNVLVYLVQHRDRVVSKEELLEQLWPGRFVGESVLTSRLMAARKAVGDSGRRQRIIQTLHGRGYRFVAPVEERGGEPSSEAEGDGPSSPHSQGGLWHDLPPAPGEPPVRDRPILLAGDDARSATPAIPGVGQVVGRRAELVQLLHWLQRALTGTRQVGFVTGEAGLGKTTLVEAFIAELGAYGTLWIGRGQCLEHYGAGEAYRPVLEAFGRLCHEPEGQKLLALLVHQAPTWVVQMPWLVSDAELERLQRRVLGVTRERMLREMAEAIEVLTAAHPLVLILEDLHWSDASTLALVASLARRQESARLLLLGTYRLARPKRCTRTIPCKPSSTNCNCIGTVRSCREPQQHRSRSILLAREDPQVFGLARLASILWYLGYPDQALQRSQAAITLARELGHPYSLVMALIFAAGHHQRRREGNKTLMLAEEALGIAREQGFALRHAEAMGLRGWALAQQGQGEAGIIQIRQGLAAERSAGIGTGQLYRLALLADAYGQTGQISEGLQVFDEALRRVDHYGSRPWVAELQRLKGEFLLVHGTDQGAAAEDCFRQALDIARRRRAKSLELRAAMSLSRLWRRQGKCDQARVLLAPIYGWFTEGFDTADLREGKALLEELS